ncbi:hypothetical protein RUM44_012546 [Polyplax serrata]|uniref:Uncharacterized protein n=1 Tax=Polyplax serrata TaxID=468196 RepID=A0ABR1BBK6_POLSC
MVVPPSKKQKYNFSFWGGLPYPREEVLTSQGQNNQNMPCLLVRDWGAGIARYEPGMGECRTHSEVHVEIRSGQSEVHVHPGLMTLEGRSHGVVHGDGLVGQHSVPSRESEKSAEDDAVDVAVEEEEDAPTVV